MASFLSGNVTLPDHMTDKRKILPGESTHANIADFLSKVANTPVINKTGESGRLIFSMDATASRKPSWDTACQIQGQMFEETSSLGGLSIQLAYYRGYNEFSSSAWHNKSADLLRSMTEVTCLGGMTQIEKVLQHAIRETKISKVNAVVFVGDAMEENVDSLCKYAGELGLLGTPVFIFQENSDPVATMAFKQIAKLSNGAYCLFNTYSAQQLKDLLSAVAIYAAGGRKALENYSNKKGGITLKLTQQFYNK